MKNIDYKIVSFNLNNNWRIGQQGVFLNSLIGRNGYKAAELCHFISTAITQGQFICLFIINDEEKNRFAEIIAKNIFLYIEQYAEIQNTKDSKEFIFEQVELDTSIKQNQLFKKLNKGHIISDCEYSEMKESVLKLYIKTMLSKPNKNVLVRHQASMILLEYFKIKQNQEKAPVNESYLDRLTDSLSERYFTSYNNRSLRSLYSFVTYSFDRTEELAFKYSIRLNPQELKIIKDAVYQLLRPIEKDRKYFVLNSSAILNLIQKLIFTMICTFYVGFTEEGNKSENRGWIWMNVFRLVASIGFILYNMASFSPYSTTKADGKDLEKKLIMDIGISPNFEYKSDRGQDSLLRPKQERNIVFKQLSLSTKKPEDNIGEDDARDASQPKKQKKRRRQEIIPDSIPTQQMDKKYEQFNIKDYFLCDEAYKSFNNFNESKKESMINNLQREINIKPLIKHININTFKIKVYEYRFPKNDDRFLGVKIGRHFYICMYIPKKHEQKIASFRSFNETVTTKLAETYKKIKESK